jgi:phosphopantetheinyl transferase
MQAVESQTLILYHTDLRDHWPEGGGRALAARLPYARRLALRAGTETARASLAGIALALRALTVVLGRPVALSEIVFAEGAKPQLAAGPAAADFSIAHSGTLVGCAAVRGAQVGFDVEQGTDERLNNWVAREATVKAAGIGMRAMNEVTLEQGGAQCRGRRWHGRRLDAFPGATACIMSSIELGAVQLQALTLADLFA